MSENKVVISVKDLKKQFKVPQKSEGFMASFKSLFHRVYREVKAVDGVSFEIKEGELVAFLGPNGAGKTTTLKMLAGILHPSAGKVSVLDFTPQDRKPQFQKQITLIMGQKNQLWWDLPPTDTYLLNKDIYNIPNDQYQSTLEELVDILDVKDIMDTPVRKLSLGQRMKCELIAALLHKPKVIFLDEPTIGLDIVVQRKIRAFLKEYNRKYNATIILTSHYMDDVKEICDRVILINRGRKVYDDQIKNLIANYAKDKYLKVDFEKEVQKSDLQKVGEIIHFDGYSATVSVPRNEHAKKVSELLMEFPVDNIDIQEIELEDILIRSFSEHV
jgi:ABC-2 type transport system ATP-binding protein